MDFQDREVVVTGGTGALGNAVVGALWQRAPLPVPYRSPEEAQRFSHRNNARALMPLADLADEAAVTAFYGGLKNAVGLDSDYRRFRLSPDRPAATRPC